MKKLFIYIALSSTIGLAACSDNQCGGFSVEMQRMYFPYTNGQTLAFANDAGDTLTFNVSKILLSEPYTLPDKKRAKCDEALTVELSDTATPPNTIAPILSLNMYRQSDAGLDNTNWMPEHGGYEIYAYAKREDSSIISALRLSDIRYIRDPGITLFNHLLHYQKDTVLLALNMVYSHHPPRFITILTLVKDKGIESFVTNNGQWYNLVE